MPMNPREASIEAKSHRFSRPRQQVAALIVAHLGLVCLGSAASVWLEVHSRRALPELLQSILDASLFGLQVGQLTLLVCWGAFAGQPWILRLARFLALAAWTVLLDFLGMYWIEGRGATVLVEEQFAQMLLLLFSPVVILFSFRIASRRQFTHGDSPQTGHAWQFSTRRLLLVTAEAAALLAIGRIVLPGNLKMDEIWTGLTGNRAQDIVPAFVSVTVLPIVYLALARQGTWQRYSAIGLYNFLISLGMAWWAVSFLGIFQPVPALSWWSEFAIAFLGILWVHTCAAATILFTFYLLRRIGYDFRRRDEEPLGRNSSNAKSSAASASA